MMENNNPIFPTIQRKIDSFIEDEEGNIPAGKLLTIGTLLVLLSSILGMTALAGHSSHSSHSSHTSHSSTSSHRSHVSHTSHRNTHGNSHGSHASHASHSNAHSSHASHASHSNSHSSHGSHTSHSNVGAHSNANYSLGGDYGTPAAPEASSILAPPKPEAVSAVDLPDINLRLAAPESSAVGAEAVIGKPIQVPVDTPIVDLQVRAIKNVPETPKE